MLAFVKASKAGVSRIHIARRTNILGVLLHWLQTKIKITVLYVLTTVLYFPYSTLDILWHSYIVAIDFLFDPPMHKPTMSIKVNKHCMFNMAIK